MPVVGRSCPRIRVGAGIAVRYFHRRAGRLLDSRAIAVMTVRYFYRPVVVRLDSRFRGNDGLLLPSPGWADSGFPLSRE